MLKRKKSKPIREEERKEERYDNSEQARNTVDSQTGNSGREAAEHNSSFITFGRLSDSREEVGEIEKLKGERFEQQF